MSEELAVLKIAAQRLNKAEMAYMISGSIAANYYTVPRMTRDIDIVIELKNVDVDKFVSLFERDFYIDKEMIKKEVARQGIFNLIHQEYVVKIDFIVRNKTEFQNSIFSRRKKISIDKKPIWFISPEDLILAKLIWAKDSHSEMQLKDVHNLFGTVKDLDLKYIKSWVSKLGLEKIYNEVNS